MRLEVAVTTGEGHEDAVRNLIEVAKKSCLVARSLACPVEVAATVMHLAARNRKENPPCSAQT